MSHRVPETSHIVPDSSSTVVVAMSGGVDSSVAAAILVEQGFDVIGVMMRLWSETATEQPTIHNRCCTPDQIADARRVAERLQIPFYVLDSQSTFRNIVVQYFLDEHARGRTPNPCIECNRQVRFTYLLEWALDMGADYLATGHYARIRKSGEIFELVTAIDLSKDQSYVLHVLGQHELAHTLFPVGEYTKKEVRQLAVHFGLPVAEKAESMDLCFVNDGDHGRFMKEHSPDMMESGPITTEDGQVLGRHFGLPKYTIGQRKGLGIAAGKPVYVLRKEPDRNALIIGPRRQLATSNIKARDVNWVVGYPPEQDVHVQVKIRYRAVLESARIIIRSNDCVEIVLDERVFAATPGQGVVFYQGDVCIGGGIIDDGEP